MTITMNKLAKLAGVTRPAVSAVLNNSTGSRVSPEKRARILQLVEETGYVPNLAARQLKGISDRLVGLVTVPSHMGIMTTMQAELISALQRAGYEALTAQCGDLGQVLKTFQARNISGVITLGMLSGLENNKLFPFVTCSRYDDSESDVSCDVKSGCRDAAEHLIRIHGRRRPVFVSVSSSLGLPNELKLEGIRSAMRENSLTPGADDLLETRIPGDPGDAADAREIVKELIRRKADCVLCANDFIAARLLPWLGKAGIRVPDDMAVVGFDGYAWTTLAAVPLATVVQPIRKIAELTVKVLVAKITGEDMAFSPESRKLKPVFLPADSCGCKRVPPAVIDGIGENMMLRTGGSEMEESIPEFGKKEKRLEK